MKKILILLFLIALVFVGYYAFGSRKTDAPLEEDRLADYISTLPDNVSFLVYSKAADISLEDWINANAADIKSKGITVETPVTTQAEYQADVASCDPAEGPCGGSSCDVVKSDATTIQYRCGRLGTQYILTNKASTRVIVLENFGQDSPMTSEQVFSAVSFR